MPISHHLHGRPAHAPDPGVGEAEAEIQQDLEVLLARLLPCFKRWMSRLRETCVLQTPSEHREVWLLPHVYMPDLRQNSSRAHTELEPCWEGNVETCCPASLNWHSRHPSRPCLCQWKALSKTISAFITRAIYFSPKPQTSENTVGDLLTGSTLYTYVDREQDFTQVSL